MSHEADKWDTKEGFLLLLRLALRGSLPRSLEALFSLSWLLTSSASITWTLLIHTHFYVGCLSAEVDSLLKEKAISVLKDMCWILRLRRPMLLLSHRGERWPQLMRLGDLWNVFVFDQLPLLCHLSRGPAVHTHPMSLIYTAAEKNSSGN